MDIHCLLAICAADITCTIEMNDNHRAVLVLALGSVFTIIVLITAAALWDQRSLYSAGEIAARFTSLVILTVPPPGLQRINYRFVGRVESLSLMFD